MDKSGVVDVSRVADVFRMSKGQLAETTGLGVASVTKAERRIAPKAQTRVTEMLEIISPFEGIRSQRYLGPQFRSGGNRVQHQPRAVALGT